MNWMDIAGIVFVCVTMNHLGLVGAAEEMIGRKIPIVNCPKCSTMWATLVYLFGETEKCGLVAVLAISFLASYAAIWVELLEGYVDIIYMKLYEKIYHTSNDTPAADADGGYSAGSVS